MWSVGPFTIKSNTVKYKNKYDLPDWSLTSEVFAFLQLGGSLR